MVMAVLLVMEIVVVVVERVIIASAVIILFRATTVLSTSLNCDLSYNRAALGSQTLDVN